MLSASRTVSLPTGKVRDCDPHHLIFSIWSTTQHYADFDVQVKAVLGAGRDGADRFEEAARFLEGLFVSGLILKPSVSP